MPFPGEPQSPRETDYDDLQDISGTEQLKNIQAFPLLKSISLIEKIREVGNARFFKNEPFFRIMIADGESNSKFVP